MALLDPLLRKLVNSLRTKLQTPPSPPDPRGVGTVTMGTQTYGFDAAVRTWQARESVQIGSWCSAGDNVQILAGGNHPQHVGTYPFRSRLLDGWFENDSTDNGPVVIGSDVWVGMDATILSGVEIGHGSIVAAGSMVTKSFPPYSVIGGNPARLIRRRFDEATIAALLRIAWWDWPETRIRAAIDDFYGDVGAFVAKYG